MSEGTQLETLNEPRINVFDRSELKRWAGELRVSQKQLIKAIEKAGTGIEAIKNELRRKTTLRTPS